VSGVLPLASAIATLDRDALLALVRQRRVASPDGVVDSLGLAFELLRSDSLSRSLQQLERSTLLALAAAARDADELKDEVIEQLLGLGLLGLDGEHAVALPEVTAALEAACAAAGIVLETERGEPMMPAAEPVDTSGWYAPAITSVRIASALMPALREHPAALGRRGSISAASVRELAHGVHGSAESIGRLLEVMHESGLLTTITGFSTRDRHRSFLVPSTAAAEWVGLSLQERWVRLAVTAWQRITGAIRTSLDRAAGDLDRAVFELIPRDFPLLPETARGQAQQLARLAHDLGLTVHGRLAPPAQLLDDTLRSGATDASAVQREAEASFPAQVPGIYVQPDLSIIIPGPLAPADERLLSAISEAEHWGVAVTLRVSPASLRRALAHGLSADTIRALLERLSLTGVPQPLDYLLSDLQRLSGAGMDPAEANEAAEANETTADPVAPALSAPAAHSEPTAPELRGDPLAELVDRVLAAAASDSGTGDLGRRLELAIRDRSPVRVIAAAGGAEHAFTLLPVSLISGRLRATDEVAGVQRTLPLSAIVSVEAA